MYEVALSVRSGSVRLAINEESCTVLESAGCSSFGTDKVSVRQVLKNAVTQVCPIISPMQQHDALTPVLVANDPRVVNP